MKKMNILYKVFDNKTISWLENKNEYLVLENTTADILNKLNSKTPIKEIAETLSQKLDVPVEKVIDFILELEKKFFDENVS